MPSSSNFPASHLRSSELGLIAQSYRAFSSPPLGRGAPQPPRMRGFQDNHVNCCFLDKPDPGEGARSGLGSCDRCHRFTLWVPHHFLDALRSCQRLGGEEISSFVLLLVQGTLNEMMEAHGADWSATLQRTGVLSVGVAHVMSRARLRELVVLFAIGSALTVAVFFLALWLLPFERFTRFPLPRFPALFN